MAPRLMFRWRGDLLAEPNTHTRTHRCSSACVWPLHLGSKGLVVGTGSTIISNAELYVVKG